MKSYAAQSLASTSFLSLPSQRESGIWFRPMLGLGAVTLVFLVCQQCLYQAPGAHAVWTLWLATASLLLSQFHGAVALLSEAPGRHVRKYSSSTGFDALTGSGKDLRPVLEKCRQKAIRSFGIAIAALTVFALCNQ